MKKYIMIFCLCVIVVLFIFLRNEEPQKSRDRIKVGMSLGDVVNSLQSGLVEPYSCFWGVGDESKLVATRNCSSPGEKYLADVSGGYRMMVVFKGIGMDYDFEIEFDSTGKVKVISDGSVR
jgi:hypothetical protein